MLNLTGKSKETKQLKGQVFDSDKYVCNTSSNSDALMFYKLDLLVLFGDFESAAKVAIEIGNKKLHVGNPVFIRERFLRSIALYAMARETRKRKYKRYANKLRQTIVAWMKKGNPNVKHYLSLLNAEHAALEKKLEVAKTYYREAIVLAARSGHLHDAGLSSERYADLLCQESQIEGDSNYQLKQAIKFYDDWGAKAKVQLLELRVSGHT